MSKKRKAIPEDSKLVKKVESEVIPYRVFFFDCLAKGLVKSYQEKEIHAFFRDLGLQDKEPVDKYRDALTRY